MLYFILEYTYASVEAINARYFDFVSDYISEDGPRRIEAAEYIDYLESENIYEEWLDSELESVVEIDPQMWEVTMLEEFEIIKPDSTDIEKFRITVIVTFIEDQYYVDELVETNEL